MRKLLNAGYEVVVVDNLYNASEKALDRVEEITGKKVTFYNADIRDKAAMDAVFDKEQVDAVIHFAGLKAVGESVVKPIEYYENNIAGTLNLCDSMRNHGVKNIIFSSSATVYGDPAFTPNSRNISKGTCTNPYGWTKWMLEQILTDLHTADPEWNVILLRYFNPIGAHKSGMIRRGPQGYSKQSPALCSAGGYWQERNVWVSLAMIMIHRTEPVSGLYPYGRSCSRPCKSAEETGRKSRCAVYNLGTGHGYSVLQVVHAFEKACGHAIKYEIEERRAGDIAMCYCDPEKAKRELGWEAQYGIDEMCEDSWRWQSQKIRMDTLQKNRNMPL